MNLIQYDRAKTLENVCSSAKGGTLPILNYETIFSWLKNLKKTKRKKKMIIKL